MYAMILDEKLNFKWCEMPDPVRKDGEVIIDDTLKIAIDAYYEQYGVK